MKKKFSHQNMALDLIFFEAIKKGIFPGAVAALARGGLKDGSLEIHCYGTTAYQGDEIIRVDEKSLYDLASLTKPLATLPALLCLIKDGVVKLDDKLGELLQKKVPKEKRDISLRYLLGHSSGLPAYLPFYQILKKRSYTGLPPAKISEEILNIILAEPLTCSPGKQSVYSDLGFILAGMIVEIKSGENLADFVGKRVFEPLGLGEKIFFNTPGRFRPGTYAPGEYCCWRQRLLRGEVGDENCALMGGAAGHAGLFANIAGVTGIIGHLFDLWLGRKGSALFNREDLLQCFSRQTGIATTWALGVDTPSAVNSSGGKLLSQASLGHLGFSGTSFWLDPERELAVVLLSNRVHPSRYNDQIKNFRPLFHDTVIETL